MDTIPETQAISAARAFANRRGLRFEEPIVAHLLEDRRYRVILPVEGASDPNLVIDPPELIVEVDLEKDEVSLVPAM